MELGRCPRCTTPYTSSEITGFGILRARSARQGGPRVEYTCQGCGAMIRLIPHGEGRYAPPGQPPPASVPEKERRAPWAQDGARPEATREPGVPEREPARAAPEPEPEPLRVPLPEDDEAPLGPAEALQVLGVNPSAGPKAIEKAFRERSLACHPDKVAHLDADFQALAERKFRRLQQAYDLLTRA